MTQDNINFNHSVYHHISSRYNSTQCQKIYDYFYNALNNNSDELSKTHFFHGRYENIYLKNNHLEPLNQLLREAKQQAAMLLNCATLDLSMDYWFNHMPPKHTTDWHRHDVMDERLSGVFYIEVPKKSGDLLLKSKPTIKRISPQKNHFIYFKPDIEHSVEENKSNQARLSIGMNFGFIADQDD